MKALKKTQYLIQIQGLFTKTKAPIYTNRIKLNLNKKRRFNFYQILKIKGKKSIDCNPSKACNKEAHNNVGDVMIRCISAVPALVDGDVVVSDSLAIIMVSIISIINQEPHYLV